MRDLTDLGSCQRFTLFFTECPRALARVFAPLTPFRAHVRQRHQRPEFLLMLDAPVG
jgi:hypothetical protein